MDIANMIAGKCKVTKKKETTKEAIFILFQYVDKKRGVS
jgi:hypothetical protein